LRRIKIFDFKNTKQEFHIDCVNLYFRRITKNNFGADMGMKFTILSSFLLVIILCAGCSDTPGEKEFAEQKALMAECQAAGSVAQIYFNTAIEKGGGGNSFVGYKIPHIIKTESSGAFAVKQSNGIIRIIEQKKEAKNGDIVLAQIDNEWTLKILKKDRINRNIYLQAANPKYPNFFPQQELNIHGIVKAVIRKIN